LTARFGEGVAGQGIGNARVSRRLEPLFDRLRAEMPGTRIPRTALTLTDLYRGGRPDRGKVLSFKY
jgi:hypothetical protein